MNDVDDFVRNRHTGQPHEFETVCRRCGLDGVLHVSVISNDEVVKVEMRPLCAGCGASFHSLRHFEGCPLSASRNVEGYGK